MRILVTDAEQRAALAVVRSLGRAGHEVWTAGVGRGAISSSSRYSKGSLIVPDPLSRPAAFIDALGRAAEQLKVDVLLPVTDASTGLVLRYREVVERHGVRVPFADAHAYEAISDKQRVLEEAAAVGIAVPRQIVTPVAGRPVPGTVAFPVVLKPSRSVVEQGVRRSQTRVLHAGDERELLEGLGTIPAAAYPVLIQERIAGSGVGVFLLRWEGEIKARFCHRRVREKPPSGGVSVLRESHPMDPDLYRHSVALLERHDWEGPAMIEYKVSSATGVPYLMEVNGRYWGSLQLAIDAGVDFPALHVSSAAGVTVEPVLDYRIGVTTRWLLGDLDHLLTRLRHSRDALALPPDTPGRVRALGHFLAAFKPGVRSEVFRWRDPAPAFAEMVAWALKALD